MKPRKHSYDEYYPMHDEVSGCFGKVVTLACAIIACGLAGCASNGYPGDRFYSFMAFVSGYDPQDPEQNKMPPRQRVLSPREVEATMQERTPQK